MLIQVVAVFDDGSCQFAICVALKAMHFNSEYNATFVLYWHWPHIFANLMR